MRNLVKTLKDKKYVGVAELAENAARALEGGDARQEKATVTEYPDERTVRYYLSEGLLATPAERQGTAAVFGYEHLLTLLTIKKMQAENLSIKKIREILFGKSIDELEKLLGLDDDPGGGGKNEAQEFLESLLTVPGRERSAFQSQLFSRASPPAAVHPTTLPTAPPKESQSWERFELEEGLELHVEKNYRASSDSKERRTLIKVIEDIIQSLGNK
jgi:DNA-binding transcriptional MerR regulator